MIRTARRTITDHTNRAAARRQVRRVPQGRTGTAALHLAGLGQLPTPERPGPAAIARAIAAGRKLMQRPRRGLGDYGTTYNPYNQTYTYDPTQNPLLAQGVTGTTGLTGGVVTQTITNTLYATSSAAATIAQQLGGQVVTIPTPWQTNTPQYGIQLPDGTVVNAGAIANIIGNDAAYPSAAVKAGAIDQLLGRSYSTQDATTEQSIEQAPPAQLTSTPAVSTYITTNDGQRVTQSTTAAPTSAGARVAFLNLATGSTSQARANEKWRVTITGAAPGQVVSITAHKDSGPDSSSNYGTTDAAGNWSLEGASSAADAGTWYESWKVAGQTVGQIVITILPAAASTTTTTATGSSSGTTAAGSSSGTTAAGSSKGSGAAATPSGVNFPAIAAGLPWYAWAIGAFVAYKVSR